jgi:multidrug efflux pump subunit AcrB
MVPLGAIMDLQDVTGPDRIQRYNLYASAEINGNPAPGFSSGQGIAMMESLADQVLAPGYHFEWTEMAYQEKLAGNSAIFIFPLCILFVWLAHSAEYESFALSTAIILIVPMCLLCGIAGVWLRGMDNNIFTQIGFVVLIGLACKNAILIVEFARDRQQEGASRFDAAVEAARVRLRPIIMTSACFVHMVPPYFATGAGAEMRRSLGTAVLWGAFGVTLFGIFLTPVFYSVVRRLTDRKEVKPALRHETEGAPAGPAPERPAWATVGASHAHNGEAEHAGLDLRTRRVLDSRRS